MCFGVLETIPWEQIYVIFVVRVISIVKIRLILYNNNVDRISDIIMKKEQLTEVLQEFGLTEHEAFVYLASIQIGPSTVISIADAASIKRTTVYGVLESLQQKGLVRIEVKGFKQLFTAESPEKLETVLELRRAKLKSALPELSALYNLKGGESFIKYYEGLEAMRNAYDSLIEDLHPKDDYFVLANEDYWYALDADYFEGFRQRRKKVAMNCQLIFKDSELGRMHKRLQRNYNCTVKLLPAGVNISTNLIVIPKKVVIHQLVEPNITIIIENKSVVQMHQEMFRIIWNALPE